MNKVTERLREGRMEMFTESFRAAGRSDPPVQMGRKYTLQEQKKPILTMLGDTSVE